MLPTTGYFKNIDCPYYNTSCDRPYCHFKHRKKNHEPVEIPAPIPSTEVPTYNPTPKSQLANARSHIPISYVPDLAIRTERNNFRSLSSYRYSDKQPTYKPTPLSILSTGKANNLASNNDDDDNKIEPDMLRYSPTPLQDNSDEINFEDLETEFDMIDELISDSGPTEEVLEEEPVKSKPHSNSKHEKKRENGKIDSKSKVKPDAKSSKSEPHSSKRPKTESTHKSHKSPKPSKEKVSKKEDKRGSKEDKKKNGKDKQGSKERHSSRHKEASKEKEKHSKPKERDKNRERDKKSSREKKHRPQDKDHRKIKTSEGEKAKLDASIENCDISDSCDNGDHNYLDFEDSDLEEDPMEECYKIFTEYKPTEPQIFPEMAKQEPLVVEEAATLFGRKRIAHENVEKSKPKVSYSKPAVRPSAAQTLVSRYKAARLNHASNEQDDLIAEINRHVLKRSADTLVDNNRKLQKVVTTNAVPKPAKAGDGAKTVKPSTSTSLVDDILSGRSTNAKPRRIAPVQNVNSIQRAKAKIEEMAKMKAVNAIIKSTTQSTSKGQKRVAHVPEFSVADVPELLETERSKLPVNVRTRYLTMIVEECMKLYLIKEEAQQRAINEEYKCYERCAALVTYRNSAMLAINRLRKEFQEREMSGLGPILPGEVSSSNKGTTCELKGVRFHENIKRFILSDEELVLHGFPREGSTPGRAIVKQRQSLNVHLDENDRVCSRCSKHYRVDDDGLVLYEEECLYHPLKKRTFRGESIYLCCKTGEGAGCVTSPTHVCDRVIPTDSEVEGYQMTMPPEYDDDPRSVEVFALDCEMCYTTKGLELTRVTIVNADCKTVYETLVKPLNPIIDYNTRFSGITAEQMNRTATSILQVQANILHLCNSNTILIGHSLESDMKALKIIHSTVIDTSVLFPHKFGLPHKRALRDLAREFLKKIIQNDISGHDSAEDALTCMELVQWKVKEEFKARGVKV